MHNSNSGRIKLGF